MCYSGCMNEWVERVCFEHMADFSSTLNVFFICHLKLSFNLIILRPRFHSPSLLFLKNWLKFSTQAFICEAMLQTTTHTKRERRISSMHPLIASSYSNFDRFLSFCAESLVCQVAKLEWRECHWNLLWYRTHKQNER